MEKFNITHHPDNTDVKYFQHNFENFINLLGFTPHVDRYCSSIGGRTRMTSVAAILPGGREIELEKAIFESNGDNHIPDYEKKAETVGEQIAGIGAVALRITEVYSSSWDNDEWNQCLVPVTPIDWVKIRRRVEDRLRKDKKLLQRVALLAEVNLI